MLALLLLLFIAYYRVGVRRNVWVLYTCFGGYFLANASLYTARWYLGGKFASTRNLIGPMFYILALSGAVLSLSRAGESEPLPISAFWRRRNVDLEAVLSSQLQDLNHTLLKVLRS